MKLDYKKAYKDIYMPKTTPSIIDIPVINYVAVKGKGNPNEEGREYSRALGALYAISFAIKMSYKTDEKIDGYFEYVVPPLEGLWWMDGIAGIDYNKKDQFNWISMIRLPEFVTADVFKWAVEKSSKKADVSKAEFFEYDEGLCVQCMHIGSYDSEPETVDKMDEYMTTRGYELDFSQDRMHHEIYLNDPRKTAAEKLKTVIRHPIKLINS